MTAFLRNKYEFLIMSSIVIPFSVIMILGKRINSIDLSLVAILCLLWPLLGMIAVRGHIKQSKALMIILVYFLIFIAYIIKAILLIDNVVYSTLINAITSMFVVILPLVVSKSVTGKIYFILAIALIFWFSSITYLYSMIPKGLILVIFLLSFLGAMIPIKIVLRCTGMWRINDQ